MSVGSLKPLFHVIYTSEREREREREKQGVPGHTIGTDGRPGSSVN